MRKLLLGILLASFFSNTLYASPISITDAWDVSQGSVITADSGGGAGDLRNMFGGNFSTAEPGNAFFGDSQAAGFVHFVEWQSASSISLTGYHLQSLDDDRVNAGDRGFTSFSLFAKETFLDSFAIVDVFTPTSNPYPSHIVDEIVNFSPVTAQFFRAEFVQFAPNSAPGPRIVELDAITSVSHSPVPEPSTMLLLGSGLIGLVGYNYRRKKEQIT